MVRRLAPLVTLVALAVACAQIDTPTGPGRAPMPAAPTPGAPPAPPGIAIEFRVTASSLLSQITIRPFDPLNGLTIVTTDPPYLAAVTIRDATAFVSLEAHSTGLTFSTLQVQIFTNGRLFREAAAVGSVLVAATSGTIRQ